MFATKFKRFFPKDFDFIILQSFLFSNQIKTQRVERGLIFCYNFNRMKLVHFLFFIWLLTFPLAVLAWEVDFSYWGDRGEPTVGLIVNFRAEVSSEPGELKPEFYYWDFGDGSTTGGRNYSQVAHIFKPLVREDGDYDLESNVVYRVTLTAKDRYGRSIQTARNVLVKARPNLPPLVDFSFIPKQPQPGQKIYFSSFLADQNSVGFVKSQLWDFGDGTTSSAKDPTHIYEKPGAYKIELTATDNEGLSASKIRYVRVGLNISDGSLLKLVDSPKVWHIQGDYRHWIPNPHIFNLYKFSWSDIQTVSQEVLESFTISHLLKAYNSFDVYWIDEHGRRHLIWNETTFKRREFNWAEVVEVIPEEILYYAQGETLY